MLPITHAVIDSDGDVLDTFGLYTQAVEAAINDAHRVVPLYDLTCFDLLAVVMWNGHKKEWDVRARGSNTYHRSRLLREAVGLAVAEVARGLSGEVALLDAQPEIGPPVVEEDALW